MPRCTCASVPAKIRTIAAARHTIVSFSDVIRSKSFRSMFLESNGLNKFHEIRFLFFHGLGRAGKFKEPSVAITACPGGEQSRIRAAHVNAGKIRVAAFHLNDQ